MTLRLTGAAMLIVGGWCLGLYYGSDFNMRRRELTDLKNALLFMYTQTEFLHTPLSPMCRAAAERCDGFAKSVLHSFSVSLAEGVTESIADMWRLCIEATDTPTYLTAEDKTAFVTLGTSLGTGAVDEQLTAITVLTEYIDTVCEELAKEGGGRLRLYKSAGVLLGALLVILLF